MATPRLRFDFVDADNRAAPLIFARPSQVIEAWRLDDVVPALKAVESARMAGRYVAGWIAYEAAPAFDPALTTRPPADLPLVWLGVFEAAAVEAPNDNGSERPLGTAAALPPPAAWAPDVTRDAYDTAIARIRAAIAAGDSYQANYTFRLRAHAGASDPAALYLRALRDHRPSYAAHLDIGPWQVLSLSPELFFRVEAGVLTTRPMKGTAGRGRFGAEDARQAATLRTSTKNRAENVMIVDLMRNDLGRIAEIGSVAVPSLFDIERYPSVFQMTSTVTARLRPGTSLTEIFAALFPAGSITGAPKTSSMRLIADVEASPRGIYCGAIGFVRPNGDAIFNVAIRTAVIDARTREVVYGVGGGITWDSAPGEEYEEALSKASFLEARGDFSLLETMRLERGRFVRDTRHLARMARSADYFGRPCDVDGLRRVMTEHARRHPDAVRRARLLLSPQGLATIDSEPFVPAPPDSARAPVVLARSPVSSADAFLCHKTTERQQYERHRADGRGAFDVLLWNERGELTEFTFGNLVVELDAQRWTPPVECGLLAGVFREELLETGAIRERRLVVDDLTRASRLWLVNSLREWVAVSLAS